MQKIQKFINKKNVSSIELFFAKNRGLLLIEI